MTNVVKTANYVATGLLYGCSIHELNSLNFDIPGGHTKSFFENF